MLSPEERIKILKDALPNSWIALSADESRVLASGQTYSDAVKLAEAKGESEPVLIKTPESWLDRVYDHCL